MTAAGLGGARRRWRLAARRLRRLRASLLARLSERSAALGAAPALDAGGWFEGGARERPPAPPNDLASTWSVLFVAAAMGFLACLGIAAANGADALARSWTTGLEARATLIVATPEDPAQTAAALDRALEAARGAPGVVAATLLDDQAVAALLAPWLGENPGAAASLPLPALIDIELAPGVAAPVEALTERLALARVEAEIDAHGAWVARLKPAADRIRLLSHAALIAVAAAAALAVAASCSAAMAAQEQMVSVLRLIGARDGDIAGMFIRRYQLLAFVGSAVGVALAALAAFSGFGTGEVEGGAEIAPLSPSLGPDPWVWAQLAAAPLAFALLARLAAWAAVAVALRRAEA